MQDRQYERRAAGSQETEDEMAADLNRAQPGVKRIQSIENTAPCGQIRRSLVE